MSVLCEECRAPARTKRNIGGILQRRCALHTAEAERQAREDEAERVEQPMKLVATEYEQLTLFAA